MASTANSAIDVDSLKLEELKEELQKRDLKISGGKTVLQERLKVAFQQTNADDKNTDDEDDDDEDGGGEDDDGIKSSKKDKEDGSVRPARGTAAIPTSQLLSFKDIEDSMPMFSGYGKQTICKWLEEFEETSKVCRWTESHKIIYAKKLLRGSAKLFVTYEQCAKT